MKQRSLERLFRPESIAIIGVSGTSVKMGGTKCLDFLIKSSFKGKLYPINPKYNEILGIPCFASIESIPDGVDVGIISIPSASVIDVVKRFVDKQVKNLIIISSGFAEAGTDVSIDMQNQIKHIANTSAVNIVGPNCLGLANLLDNIPLTYSTALETPFLTEGGIGLVTQSGAIGTYIIEAARSNHLPIGLWASTGNEVDVEFSDIGTYMVQDDSIRMIAGYIEGITSSASFKTFVTSARLKQKPVVLLKVGSTSKGAVVAKSHTASMTGKDEVYDAYFKQHHIIRAESVNDLLDYTMVFGKISSITGNRVAIITTSGGMGVLSVDMAEKYGVEVANLQPETIKTLQSMNQNYSLNPIDIGLSGVVGREGLICKYFDVLSDDPNVDVILFLSGVAHSVGVEISTEISKASKQISKPIVVGWVESSKETKQIFIQNHIPFFDDPLRAVKAIGKLSGYYSNMAKDHYEIEKEQLDQVEVDQNRASQARALLNTDGFMNERMSKQLLEIYRIPTTKGGLARNRHEAAELANNIGYPVVIKIESPDIIHKTEVNGVVINIQSEDELVSEFDNMIKTVERIAPSAKIDGIYVQEMVKQKGLELICGVSTDETFGKYLMIGRGGIEAELYKDVSRKVFPISRKDIDDMVQELTCAPLLTSYRNMPKLDREGLVQAISNLAALIMEIGDSIQELDLNPILVYEDGVKALDARIITKS